MHRRPPTTDNNKEKSMSLTFSQLFDISGKVALVTGGSSGIGLMIATGLAANGVKTYIVGRKADQLEEARTAIAKHGTCLTIQADLSLPGEIERVARELCEREPKLNILVNNAGATWGGNIEDYPEKGWDRVFNLNTRSLFFLTQKLLPQLSAAATDDDWSRVINLSSVGARIAPTSDSVAYAASKAAVEQMTRVMARGFAGHRTTANAIAPGWFPSRMNAPMSDEARREWLEHTPVARFGTIEDMTGIILFLTSKAGSFINGQILTADGGRTL
jgi:NAD(P)-dependent dehydrogenase (short-subunit alcohol dehydrogenase family)